MSKTSALPFGMISTFNFKNPVWPTFELINFHSTGRSHAHELKELALCASGEGWASVGGEMKKLGPGSLIEIPSNTIHYFSPKAGEILAMVIFHERCQP